MTSETYSTWNGRPPSYSLGFKHPGVAAGERVEVDACPAIDFEGYELAFSNPRFQLLDVIVGGRSQFRASQRRLMSMDPAGAFRFVSHMERMPLDLAERGSKVTLLVKNASGETAPFFGSIFGTSPQKGYAVMPRGYARREAPET
jgi:hypothetical protein